MFAWVALGLAFSAGVGRPGKIPQDVERCIRAQKMWVAQPDFFERLTLGRGKGEPAYEVKDHHQGRVGYLLVLPERCRILVVIRQGEGGQDIELSYAASDKPTEEELSTLLRFAGLKDAGHAQAGYFFFLHGTVLDVVELASGQRRRFEERGAAAKCERRLIATGLEASCGAMKTLMPWTALISRFKREAP
jgi:hypothetical protein